MIAAPPLWAIDTSDLVDTYKEPNLLGDVVWRVPRAGEEVAEQRWPLFHPSEADPEGGYRLHPYTVEFWLDEAPAGSYLLCLQYLVIAPRIAYLELDVNGMAGNVYLRPSPASGGEIRLHAGLHTSIYAGGTAEVVLPGGVLRRGENRLTLLARDGGAFVRVEGIEHIRRLDRMANGAGFIYQSLSLALARHEATAPARCEVRPSPLYRRDEEGRLWEEGDLYLELGRSTAGGSVELTLHLPDGSQRQTWEVGETAFGQLRFPFVVRDGAGGVGWSLRADLDGEEIEATGELHRCRKWKVYVTPHAHTDIGYTHRQWEVAERLCRNIDRALDVLETLPPEEDPAAFAYHLDSSWALDTYLTTRSPEQLRRLGQEVRAGHIGVPSAYVDLLSQFAALEDLIRNGECTADVLQAQGTSTDFTTVVDVASLTGSFPDILAGSGVRYLVHADNQDRGPFRSLGGLHTWSPFYWEGPAGGRVLVWLAKMYCELRKVCGSPPLLEAAGRGLSLWLEEYERADYAPDAVLLYGQEADNTDLDPQPVGFVRRWNEEYAYPRLIPCAVSDFFRSVEERYANTFRTVKGDEGAYWEDGVGSDIRWAAAVRAAQAALPAAETLESLAVMHNPAAAYPRAQFDEAWRQVLLYDEHTWGAFLSGTDPEALLQRDQQAIKEHMARSAVQWAGRLLHGAAVRHSLSWNTDGREVVVYNPHNWEVSGPVTVEIARGERVVDAVSGAAIPVRRQRVTETQQEIELWVEALPGLSFRRYPLQPEPESIGGQQTDDLPLPQTPPCGRTPGGCDAPAHVDPEPALPAVRLENGHHRLDFDPVRGAAVGWWNKTLGREMVDATSPWVLGQFLYAAGGEGTRLMSNRSDLPPGDPQVLAQFRLRGQEIERQTMGSGGTSLLRLWGEVPGGRLDIEWVLPDAAPWVEVRYTYHKEPGPPGPAPKEAVYVAFPLHLPGAQVLSDSHLGWVDWQRDELPGGCKEWLPLQTSVLLHGDDADALICSPDIPLFCVGDIVRGRWPREMDLSGGRIFSYVLNNYWHTNYPTRQSGEISFRYRLNSGRGMSEADAYRQGWEARRPLYAHRISLQEFRQPAPPYSCPTGGTLAHIGQPDAAAPAVSVTTLKAARRAEGYVLRLQEIAGQSQMVPVAFPGLRITRAWSCDLLERDLTELEVEADGTLHVAVAPWGLSTVRLVLAGRADV